MAKNIPIPNENTLLDLLTEASKSGENFEYKITEHNSKIFYVQAEVVDIILKVMKTVSHDEKEMLLEMAPHQMTLLTMTCLGSVLIK